MASEDRPLQGFPADCPILKVVTVLLLVLEALRVFQHTVVVILRVST